MEGFSFSTNIRVRFAETDAQGIVHNARYLVWFEVARVEYLEQYADGYQRLREQGVEALVLESHAALPQPAGFDDRLVVHSRCRRRPRRTIPLRVRGRTRRNGDRRRLDGARDRRRGTFRPTLPVVARWGDSDG